MEKKNTLTLKNPIMINGEKVSEMTYDTNEIDGVLFATAENKKKAAAGMKNMTITAVRLWPPPLPRLRCHYRSKSEL